MSAGRQVVMWRDVPDDRRSDYANHQNWNGCEAAVNYAGRGYHRCQWPTYNGAQVCSLHGGPASPNAARKRLYNQAAAQRERAGQERSRLRSGSPHPRAFAIIAAMREPPSLSAALLCSIIDWSALQR